MNPAEKSSSERPTIKSIATLSAAEKQQMSALCSATMRSAMLGRARFRVNAKSARLSLADTTKPNTAPRALVLRSHTVRDY